MNRTVPDLLVHHDYPKITTPPELSRIWCEMGLEKIETDISEAVRLYERLGTNLGGCVSICETAEEHPESFIQPTNGEHSNFHDYRITAARLATVLELLTKYHCEELKFLQIIAEKTKVLNEHFAIISKPGKLPAVYTHKYWQEKEHAPHLAADKLNKLKSA